MDVEFVIRESMIHVLRDRRSTKGMVPYRPTQESIVNKLVLAFATVAVFGLSTAAFAQNPAASTQVDFLLGRHRAAAGLDDGVERLPLVAHVALDGFPS